MFLMIGLGERAGSGVPKIFSGWKSCDWRPPALYEKDDPEQTLLELRMIDFFPVEVVARLRAHLGSAYDNLPELDRLILATVATEQVATHHRIMEISDDHAHDLTQAFQRLVKAGWLKSNGHGRGTVYHRPEQALPTPEQVFGEAWPIIAESSKHLEESSAHSNRAEEGWLIVSGIANPLIDDLQLLTSEVKQELATKANAAQSRKKIPKIEMEEIVLSLCEGYYLTLQVLAQSVNRTPDVLRQHYLKHLVEQGRLGLAFPTAPTHPQQAYTTMQEVNND